MPCTLRLLSLQDCPMNLYYNTTKEAWGSSDKLRKNPSDLPSTIIYYDKTKWGPYVLSLSQRRCVTSSFGRLRCWSTSPQLLLIVNCQLSSWLSICHGKLVSWIRYPHGWWRRCARWFHHLCRCWRTSLWLMAVSRPFSREQWYVRI